MGLFEKIFPPKAATAAQVTAYFKTLSAYTPSFTTRAGSIYEMELTRAAIHAFATHASKLKPEMSGSVNTSLGADLQSQPNPFMDTSKYLYRLATILSVDTTAFIVPIEDFVTETPRGFFPILPQRTEVVEFNGEPWLRYTFSNGQRAAIELRRVGILTKFQYKDDFFGDGNAAMSATLDLLDTQRQGMQEGIKSSATIRFMARLAQSLRSDDITKERKRFVAENLSAENSDGVMMFDAKYADVKQIESKPFLVDAEQMKLIKDNVFSYFGVNEAILQNSYDEDAWNAFYEGKIEPFALQLGLVMTNMTFTKQERAAGSGIMFSSNRLQYASNASKVSIVTTLVDRGLMSNHAAADVFNQPHPVDENGDEIPERWVIRGEYIDVANLPAHTVDQAKGYLQMPTEGEPVAGSTELTAPVEDLQATALNGAQITALVEVVTALKNNLLSVGQASHIVAVALAISVDDAKKIVEGTV